LATENQPFVQDSFMTTRVPVTFSPCELLAGDVRQWRCLAAAAAAAAADVALQ